MFAYQREYLTLGSGVTYGLIQHTPSIKEQQHHKLLSSSIHYDLRGQNVLGCKKKTKKKPVTIVSLHYYLTNWK